MNTPLSYVGQPIRSLQTMLRTIAHVDETLLKLVPDGIYGPNTVQAVREFQRQNALPVTGETDNATWNKLVAVYTVQSPSVLPAAPVTVRWTPNRTLAAGSRNSHLFLIQSMLQALARFYVNAPVLTVTGVHDAPSVAAVKWLSDPKIALYCVFAAALWQGVGQPMLYFLAGLQGIPQELYEAAAVDGAGKVATFFNVTIPQLKETFVIVLATLVIASLKVYDVVYVMTNGGPVNSTQTLASYMYAQTFSYSNLGTGSAIVVVMMVMMMVIIIPYVLYTTKDE